MGTSVLTLKAFCADRALCQPGSWWFKRWSGRSATAHRKQKGLFHVNLLKGFLPGWRRKMWGVVSQAGCIRLRWLLIYTALTFMFYFFSEVPATARPGEHSWNVPLKIKRNLKEFKIWYSNITKLLPRWITFLLYITIIKILNTLEYFPYVSQNSSLLWTCPGIFFFFFLSLFLSPGAVFSSKVSSKVLTSVKSTFPSPLKDEDVIREQLKIISAAVLTLELLEKQLTENIHLKGTWCSSIWQLKKSASLGKGFWKSQPKPPKSVVMLNQSWLLEFLLAEQSLHRWLCLIEPVINQLEPWSWIYI